MTVTDQQSIGALLNARQVATQLGLTVRAIYVLVDRGELEAYRLGRRLRFDDSAIHRFLDERREHGAFSS